MEINMAKKREVGKTFQTHKMPGTKREGPGEETGAQTTLRTRGSHSLRALLISAEGTRVSKGSTELRLRQGDTNHINAQGRNRREGRT